VIRIVLIRCDFLLDEYCINNKQTQITFSHKLLINAQMIIKQNKLNKEIILLVEMFGDIY